MIREGAIVKGICEEPVKIEKIEQKGNYFRIVGYTINSKSLVNRMLRDTELNQLQILEDYTKMSSKAENVFYAIEALRFKYASLFEILESLHPTVILERYLVRKDYIKILDIYESLMKTPGELRLASGEGFIRSIVDGVKSGIFGFGRLGADLEPEPECINCTPEIKLAEDEIIIKPDLFKREEQKKEETERKEAEKVEKIKKEIVKETKEAKVEEGPARKKYRSLYLRLQIPLGKFSDVVKLQQYLGQKFSNIQIELSIKASEGEITEQEYEDRVIEAINQAKVKLLEERKD